MRHPLLNGRLVGRLHNAWPSRCTIQTVNFTVNDANESVATGGTDVSGLLNIPCRLAPLSLISPDDREVRVESITTLDTRRALKLSGYYPQIQPRAMQAVVDGVTYQIRGNESDSEQFSTRLNLEVITPHG